MKSNILRSNHLCKEDLESKYFKIYFLPLPKRKLHKIQMQKTPIRVVELFAGVGGFRLGLEGWQGKSASSNYTEKYDSPYQTVWSNQYEPKTKAQHASWVYENRWGSDGHRNEDIAEVDVADIPEHDVLVGGFPCQDYSVATTLKNAKGLIGKKGVLWWSIHRILSEKKNKPKYLILENVDRLLMSPSKQRGRDFAIILQSLNQLNYAVEWRVINAAEFGMPQRRRRIFILAYLKGTKIYQNLKKEKAGLWIGTKGVLAEAFPPTDLGEKPMEMSLSGDITEISTNFNITENKRVFLNGGVMIDGKVSSLKMGSAYEGEFTLLRDVLQKEAVGEEFEITEEELPRWQYFKGAKKEVRTNASGFTYNYTEGSMGFPDALDKASRTIITGEGGKAASRFKHVIKTKNGHRRLTPLELERLNMFPDNHTKLEKISDTKRAFFMGNALVVGVVEQIGKILSSRI